MFQFGGFPTYTYVFSVCFIVLHYESFLIRISADRGLFAAPRSFSQLVASFFGSWCQGIPLVLLFAWTFHRPYGLSCCSLELLEFHKQIFIGIHIAVKGFILCYTIESFPPCGEIVFTHFFWKDQIFRFANLVKFCPLKSVRFYSSICFIRFSMNAGYFLFAPSMRLFA